ncbi:MAG: hypothetical protein EA411_10570 [Saprospirales bacterium]|nr:MAG: hypothetical protein EA411_10570 [Saprospirales bacterium]
MASTNDVLEQIQQRVKALIDQRDALREENESLKVELEDLRKFKSNTETGSNPSEKWNGDTAERLESMKRALKQLDQYTKELDECIQWIEEN